MALTEKYGSVDEIRAALKKSSGTNSGLFRRFKADEDCTFRFLTEMDQWEKAFYHFLPGSDGKTQFTWCSRREDCPGCEGDARQSIIWLAAALVRADGKVQILQIPTTIAEMVRKKAMRGDNYRTICDRDYIITREGTGQKDTRYSLDWEDPTPFSAKRYTVPDIAAAIMTELGLTDEDLEDTPRSKVKKHVPAKKSTSRYDDDDDMDEEDEEETRPAKKSAARKPAISVKTTSSPKRVIRRS